VAAGLLLLALLFRPLERLRPSRPWSFGPLRSVVSSPVFHRWHHTMRAEGLDKNFAGLFPIVDRAFGIEGNRVPAGLFAQLRYPFRRAAAS
jgi:sterol desaturase/sphingolipid hydroxylase (fatty acid hydroxylase superfamily)